MFREFAQPGLQHSLSHGGIGLGEGGARWLANDPFFIMH